jgi:hypothetical protein
MKPLIIQQCSIRELSLFMGAGGFGGVAPKRNVFLGKHFADPTIEKSEKFSPNLELYQ